jgi:hypothetical protein
VKSQKIKIFSTGYIIDILLSVLSFWLALNLAYGLGLPIANDQIAIVAMVTFGAFIAMALVGLKLNQFVWRWT